MKTRLLLATGLFAAGLVAIGAWRRAILLSGEADAVGAGPTLAYVGWTVTIIFLLPRFGTRFGFGGPFLPAMYLGLAAGGVLLLEPPGEQSLCRPFSWNVRFGQAPGAESRSLVLMDSRSAAGRPAPR